MARFYRTKRIPYVAEYLEEHPDCVVCGMLADDYYEPIYDPLKTIIDVHEPKTRARGGSTIDPKNSASVCRYHHGWIGEHVAEATVLGLLVPSWEATA